MKPVLYEYEDYRAFLKDAYRFMKGQKKSVSHRYLCRIAGFKSPNFLQLVMEGKRNLTIDSIPKVAKAFSMNKAETEFFENLVHFNQSKTTEEKAKYFERMTRSRGFRDIKALAQEKFEYFSKWYYPAVRELSLVKSFREDPVWISNHLVPEITVREAVKALELLEKLGLLSRDANGKLKPVEKTISSGAEVKSVAVKSFHQQMGKIGIESIDRFSGNERDVSGAMFPIPTEKVPAVKEKIQKFRQELLKFVEESSENSDQLYQLTVHFFPLSRKKGKG